MTARLYRVQVFDKVQHETTSTAVIEFIDNSLEEGLDIDCTYNTLKREIDMVQRGKVLRIDTGVEVTRER